MSETTQASDQNPAPSQTQTQTTPTTEPEGSQPPRREGPPEGHRRFSEVVRERNQLREQSAELQAQLSELTGKIKSYETTADQLRSDLALAEHGLVDTESRTVARALWQAMGDDRPPLADVVSEWRADPDRAPAGVRAYFGGGSAGVSAGQGSADGGQSSGSEQTEAPALPQSSPSEPTSGGPADDLDALDAANRAFQAAKRSGDAEQMKSARREIERILAGGVAPGRRSR